MPGTPDRATTLAIRPVTDMGGFAACEHLQQRVWGFAERDLVPRRMFMVAHQIGGLTLGAWDGERLAGFALAFPGQRPGQSYWHGHMLAVDAGYRNQGVGRALKLHQREAALAHDIDLIEWTFDPLEIKNAYFNFEVLGARSRRYYPNLYGATSSALQAGLPSDRMVAEWHLRSPRAAAARGGVRVEVPAAIHAWKTSGDPRAAEVQARNRDTLLAAFARGLVAVGFDRSSSGDGAFLLVQSRQLGSATSRAGARRRQSKPALKRPAGATERKVASHP
ncbi:MAG TPA: GNAT family N-acetyltransferase [Terriglobales bacterium]|nr:GNAT family N-acetyltransferase [Terriglobales bacterium]